MTGIRLDTGEFPVDDTVRNLSQQVVLSYCTVNEVVLWLWGCGKGKEKGERGVASSVPVTMSLSFVNNAVC